jgi:hypothetical protein
VNAIESHIDSYQEGFWALPQQEFGLDVIALVGSLRYQEHRSIPQIYQHLRSKNICISERTVTHLLARYDELLSLWLKDRSRLKAIAKKQGRVILAIDGMQPEVGHEVLWVIRDCLSGEILLAKTLLSSRNEEIAALLLEVSQTLDIPIDGVVSDGRPPLDASGLKLQERLSLIEQSLERVDQKGACHNH